jgi:hypothetical protein
LADLPDGWYASEKQGPGEDDERLCDLNLGDPSVRARFEDGDDTLHVTSATRATDAEAAAAFAENLAKARNCEPMTREGVEITAKVAKLRTFGDDSFLLRYFVNDDTSIGAAVLIRSGKRLGGVAYVGLFNDHQDLLPYVLLAQKRLAE